MVYFSKRGYTLVLDAFEKQRQRKLEPRFMTLMQMLESGPATTKVVVMTFLNTLITNTTSLKIRIELRNTLLSLDILSVCSHALTKETNTLSNRQIVKAIADAEAKINDLTTCTKIEELTASKARWNAEIQSLESDAAENQEALNQATAQQQKELAELNAEEKDALQAIFALKSAITAVYETTATAFGGSTSTMSS